MSKGNPRFGNLRFGLEALVGSFILGMLVFASTYNITLSTPAPNLCPTQLRACEGKLENLTRWDITDSGVLEKLVATHQNRSYVCKNWTEVPYRNEGKR